MLKYNCVQQVKKTFFEPIGKVATCDDLRSDLLKENNLCYVNHRTTFEDSQNHHAN